MIANVEGGDPSTGRRLRPSTHQLVRQYARGPEANQPVVPPGGSAGAPS
jgi:hypothetical protein